MKSELSNVQSSAQAAGRMAQAALRCFAFFFSVICLERPEWFRKDKERGGTG